MSAEVPPDRFTRVATVETVREDGPLVVSPEGSSIGLFADDGEIYAIDHRCPHMGFPLTEGSIEDGILTCHWHHARFELSCGDTFDPFADDVRAYPVAVHDGEVYLDPTPKGERDPVAHWKDRLQHGLRENLGLVIAKATIGLDDQETPYTVPIRMATMFGVEYNENGWGRGLTTLGVMANLYGFVRPADQRRALYAGCSAVAEDCAGQPPLFTQDALSTGDVGPERLATWFREAIEVRDADGAERVLRTALQQGASPDRIAGMLVGAATDHLYLDTGHRLDFINKAFEVLEHIGWEQADQVLPSLVPGLAGATRAEESSTWRQPIDLANLLFEAYEELPAAVETPRDQTWHPDPSFRETLLGEDPEQLVETLLDAVEEGAPAEALAREVTHAGALRVAQFGTSNEFRDWNTVHHTYTYLNAVHAMTERTDAWECYRGIFDGAMKVYLDRFLNMPPTPIPDTPETTRKPATIRSDLLDSFDVEKDKEVDRAGKLTAEYLASDGDVAGLYRTLGNALLREDVGFHTRQHLEAAFAQYERSADPERGRIHLIAATRYLSAHTPTRRAGEQTFRIAERLNHGERIHESSER